MKKEKQQREYTLSGIVNVGMYNTVLAPEVAVGEEDTPEKAWFGFDQQKYQKIVLELAEKELKLLLEKLPKERNIRYVEGSAYISSPAFYNDRNDQLHFKVVADAGQMDSSELQQYIEAYLRPELEAEFDTQYRIYQVLKENYTPADFC